MSRSGRVERILSLLHEAAIDPDGWAKASASIDETLEICGTGLVCAEGGYDKDVRVFAALKMIRGQRIMEQEQEYFASYYARDERIPRLRKQPDSKLCHVRELYSETELKTSATFNEFFARIRCQDSICVRLDGLNCSRIVLQFHDRSNGSGWSSPDLDLIRLLLPQIRQTWIVRQELAGARALGKTLTEMVETTGRGIVHLDARGQILEVNDTARIIFKDGDISSDMDRRLYARTRQDNHELQQILSRALPPFGTQAIAGSAVVRRPDGLPPLAVHVTPVSGSENDSLSLPVAALALIADPLTDAEIDLSLVKKALGLSRAEAKVAVLLAQGKDVRAIAASTHRAENTIRTQVKHILAKLELTRQGALVHLVRSLGVVP